MAKLQSQLGAVTRRQYKTSEIPRIEAGIRRLPEIESAKQARRTQKQMIAEEAKRKRLSDIKAKKAEKAAELTAERGLGIEASKFGTTLIDTGPSFGAVGGKIGGFFSGATPSVTPGITPTTGSAFHPGLGGSSGVRPNLFQPGGRGDAPSVLPTFGGHTTKPTIATGGSNVGGFFKGLGSDLSDFSLGTGLGTGLGGYGAGKLFAGKSERTKLAAGLGAGALLGALGGGTGSFLANVLGGSLFGGIGGGLA
jgi:hypothetical protein